MKALPLILVALAACTAAPPVTATTPTPTPERGMLTVTALLDLSGPRASIGTAQRNALQMRLDAQQGRTAVPVRLRTVDIGSSDARLLLELRRAAAIEPADAVIVGTPVAYDDTLARALDIAALPVLFTLPLPAEPVGRTGGRWAFALAPTLGQIASAEIDDARRRGVLAPALILSDARDRVDPAAAALAAELDRRKLDPLTRIAMPADGSVPPVIRSGLSVLRSVHCTGLPYTCAAVAQAAQSTGAPTFFYLSYLTTPADVGDRRELVERAIWPATRTILPFDGPPAMPVNVARDRFERDYGDRYGPAGAHAATAYDALTLLVTAAERGGADDRAALRDTLERMTMPLIAGTYRFGADRHGGADPEDIAFVRWSGSKLAPALAPSLGTGLTTP